MLFELFNHSVDKHLPYGTQNTHSKQMKQKQTMLEDEIELSCYRFFHKKCFD
jgi:hypothetical protein